jgi:hypothetical protein
MDASQIVDILLRCDYLQDGRSVVKMSTMHGMSVVLYFLKIT